MRELPSTGFPPVAGAPGAPAPMVPASYAEKAMASLLQLHGELMQEKERRVDLYRRLMEKEQAVVELKMYVKLLEDKMAAAAAAPPPPAPAAKEPARRPAPPPPPPNGKSSKRALRAVRTSEGSTRASGDPEG